MKSYISVNTLFTLHSVFLNKAPVTPLQNVVVFLNYTYNDLILLYFL